MTGPPIARRPRASITPSPAPGYAEGKETKQPEGLGTGRCPALHQQSFDVFELAARLACFMVIFDSGHALVQHICFQHGALHSTGAPNAAWWRGITISP